MSEPTRCNHPACGSYTWAAYCSDHAPATAPQEVKRHAMLTREDARLIPAVTSMTVRVAARWTPSKRARTYNGRTRGAAKPRIVTVAPTLAATDRTLMSRMGTIHSEA